jgi:hypothetical protein
MPYGGGGKKAFKLTRVWTELICEGVESVQNYGIETSQFGGSLLQPAL